MMKKKKIEEGNIVELDNGRWMKIIQVRKPSKWLYKCKLWHGGREVVLDEDKIKKKIGITTEKVKRDFISKEKHEQEIQKYRSAIDGLLNHLGYNHALSDVQEACEVMDYDPIKLAKEFDLAVNERRAINFKVVKK